MSDTVPVEYPVIQDSELHVRCDHSGCNKTTTIGTDIDGVESSDTGDSWRVSFVPTADNRLEVDGVECPDHRVDDAIDSLAASQHEFSDGFDKTMKIVDKLAP